MPTRTQWGKAGLFAVTVALLGTIVTCAQRDAVLDGTRWRLVGWTLSSINPQDFTITAEFDEGQIMGKSGVNSYGGPYKAGPNNAFSVGELVSTLMAGPKEAMRAERAYLTLLPQARSFKVEGSRLTLYDQGGNESLIYEAATAPEE